VPEKVALCISAAKIYPNSNTSKAQIISENKNKSGIYMFQNSIKGKRYIGSSENLKIRFTAAPAYFNVNYLRCWLL